MFDLEKDDNPEFCEWKWIEPIQCINEVYLLKGHYMKKY